MSIEVLFISLVLRKSSLDRLDPDAREIVRVLFNWEPDWCREDHNLLATTFMAPADVRAFGTALEQRTSLTRLRDWIVVDMSTGPTSPCHWLEARFGIGEVGMAWLEGAEPCELVKVPSHVPGDLKALPCTGGVVKLFGRDSHHDAEGHREDFGRFLPNWGGRDMWHLVVDAHTDANGVERPAGYVSRGRGTLDFNTLGRKRELPPISPIPPEDPIFGEGPSLVMNPVNRPQQSDQR